MQVETLEARDCPALIYGYEPDYLRSLGFDHPDAVQVVNITWRQDAAGAPVTDGPDTAFVAGPGDGPLCVVINGAARRLDPGEGALTIAREPDVLARFFPQGFDPEAHRDGLNVAVLMPESRSFASGGQELVVWSRGVGAGSVVTRVPAGDDTGGRPSLLFGDIWRGSFDVQCWDATGDGGDEIVALAGANGAPRVVIRAVDGTELSSFFVGPDSDRQTPESHYTLGTIGVQTYPGGPPTGLTVVTPTGQVRFFTFDGTEAPLPG